MQKEGNELTEQGNRPAGTAGGNTALPAVPYGPLERIRRIRCFLFDMDGTINLGMELIPGMEGFFDKLTAAGRRYYLVTNNSSKDHAHYVKR